MKVSLDSYFMWAYSKNHLLVSCSLPGVLWRFSLSGGHFTKRYLLSLILQQVSSHKLEWFLLRQSPGQIP